MEDVRRVLALELALGGLDDSGLEGVLRRPLHLVEDAEAAREILAGQGVRRRLVDGVVILRHEAELAPLARVGGIERAREKLGALTEALDETEAVVIHRSIHHLEQVLGMGVRRAGYEGGTG